MEDLNDKITGGNLPAVEWNQVPTELQNIIEDTGQSLTNADLDQVGKGVATYVAGGDFYTDSGGVNTYSLSPVGAKQRPPAYIDGFRCRFIPANTNTGASTVNVDGIGAKDIRNQMSGAVLNAGDIVAGVEVVLSYDLSNDFFHIIQASANLANFSKALLKKNWPTIANNSTDSAHDVDFSAGFIIDSVGDTPLVLQTLLTKRLDAAWAAGNNAGGRAGTLDANTTYHCFVISQPSGTTDCGFDKNLDASALLAAAVGYTRYKWVGAIITNALANVRSFTQIGDEFIWATPGLDIDDSTITCNIEQIRVLNQSIPSGIRCSCRGGGYIEDDEISSAPRGIFMYNSYINNPNPTTIPAGGGGTPWLTLYNQDADGSAEGAGAIFFWSDIDASVRYVGLGDSVSDQIEAVQVSVWAWKVDRASV